MEENFSEQLEIARSLHGKTVGLIAIEGGVLKGHLDEALEFLHKNLHPTDAILTVEPRWRVILAGTDARGVEAIVKRLPDILKERSPHKLEFGTALYPGDGRDVHSLFRKAAATTRPLLPRGK